jgi:colanic acid biosynthesis glycosyl transferase WcaI
MHILFLSHYFPPECNAPASRTYEHAREWVKHPGVQVTVITNHPHHPVGRLFPGHRNAWLKRESVEGINVIRVKTFLAANSGFGRRTLNYIFFMVAAILGSFFARRPSIVVSTSPQFFCAVAGFIVSLLKRRPFVFELRDLWPDAILAVGALKPSRAVRLLERLELFLYRRAVQIVAVTDAFKHNLVSRGIPPQKISVIKNGVDLNFFTPQPPDPDLLRSLGISGNFVVSYIGTVGLAHAIDKIIEAADLLRSNPRLLFLIIGDGAAKEHAEHLVQARALTNVRILPAVPRDKVRQFYALTDLCLVTLRKTDLFTKVIPSKMFEIMAMARPLLITVDGEARALIEQAGSGVFVQPEDAQKMAGMIQYLSTQPSRLEAMAKNGRACVLENFSRPRLATDMLEVLLRSAHPAAVPEDVPSATHAPLQRHTKADQPF